MAVKNTIFKRITREDENTSTELLVNIMEYSFLRSLIIKWFSNDELTDDILKCIAYSDIIPQFTTEENGRPDLIIKNSDCYILIENKIRTNTPLTKHEKENYVKELSNKKDVKYKKLIFLLPDNYEFLKDVKKIQNENSGLVNIKSWTKFLEYLYQEEININNSVLEHALEYLSSIIDHTDSINTTLSTAEVFMLFNPSKLAAAYELGEKICTLSKNFLEKNGLSLRNRINSAYGVGYYFSLGSDVDNKECFIGLSPSIDLEQKYILSISTHLSYIKDSVREEHREAGDEEWYFFPIDTEFILSENNQEEYNKKANAALEELKKALK